MYAGSARSIYHRRVSRSCCSSRGPLRLGGHSSDKSLVQQLLRLAVCFCSRLHGKLSCRMNIRRDQWSVQGGIRLNPVGLPLSTSVGEQKLGFHISDIWAFDIHLKIKYHVPSYIPSGAGRSHKTFSSFSFPFYVEICRDLS
jgi:hypothetical protein